MPDTTDVKDKNNFVFLKQRYVFLEQQHAKTFDYFVSITSFAVDCNARKVAFTEFIYQDDRGNTTYSVEIPRGKWVFDKEKYENYGSVCNADSKQNSTQSQGAKDKGSWIFIGKNSDAEFYADTLSIRQRDGLLHIFEKAILLPNNQNEFMKYREGKLVDTALFEYAVNCTDHTDAWVSVTFKDKSGAAIDYVENGQSKWKFSTAAPGTLSDALINTACSAISQVPERNIKEANSPPRLASTGSGFFD